jgi:hypothetical protein
MIHLLVPFTTYLTNCCFMTPFTSAFINYTPKFYARMFPSVRWLCNTQLQIHIKNTFCVNFISIPIILLLVQAMEFLSSPPCTYCPWCSTSLLSNRYWNATLLSKHSFHPAVKIKEVFKIQNPYISSVNDGVAQRQLSLHPFIHSPYQFNK